MTRRGLIHPSLVLKVSLTFWSPERRRRTKTTLYVTDKSFKVVIVGNEKEMWDDDDGYGLLLHSPTMGRHTLFEGTAQGKHSIIFEPLAGWSGEIRTSRRDRKHQLGKKVKKFTIFPGAKGKLVHDNAGLRQPVVIDWSYKVRKIW